MSFVAGFARRDPQVRALLGAAMLALRRGGAASSRLVGLACGTLGATLVAARTARSRFPI